MRLFLLALSISVTAICAAETRFVPLFPEGKTDDGWVYESPELLALSPDASVEADRLSLRDWETRFDAWTPAGEAQRLRCVVRYRGALSLSDAQMEKSKPAVLLVPAEDLSYVPELPRVSWLGRLFGYREPERSHQRNDDELNVLFLMIDTLRSDHTPPYGHPFVHAVHTEMMAALGATFANSYGASSSTRPSVGSIFSGKHPLTHGAERHAINGARLHEALDVMPEWFVERGYFTSAVSSNAQITMAFGFDQGFIAYQCPVGEHQVTPLGIQELKRIDEPFFLYLHYLAPHAPYEPPYPYDGMYEGMTAYPEQDAYCAEITLDDRRIGEVIAEVARQGLLDRTLIWLLSDHGEEFWEHGWNGHGAKLYEESVETVSIVMDANRISPGTQIDTPTIHMDILPTLLDWFGDDAERSHHGVSMLDWLTGEATEVLERGLYLHHGGGLDDAPHESDKQAVLNDKQKLIWWTEQENRWEFYDLPSDPGEQTDLAGQPIPAIEEYRSELQAHVEAYRQAGAVYEARSRQEEVRLNDTELQNLRNLGYID